MAPDPRKRDYVPKEKGLPPVSKETKGTEMSNGLFAPAGTYLLGA